MDLQGTPRRSYVLLVLTVLSVVYALLAGLRTVGEFDLGWQLATGRYVVQQGQIPAGDVFSYTARGNPWGDPMFGGTFFTLTGMHMAHVLSGVIYLGVIAGRFARKTMGPDDVEIGGLYWHFVDLVWMFIFPLVYLMSVAAGGGH